MDQMTETDKNKELFVYAFGLAALAVVFIIEANYILHFVNGGAAIDMKQFDLLLVIFSATTIVGGIIAWQTKHFDIASILLLIGALECMFGIVEYVEGSIMTITFVDYIFTALMLVSSASLYLSKKYGIAILTTLAMLMFFCFNLNNMFGVSFDIQNWCVGVFGMLAGTWCIALIFLKYLDIKEIKKLGLF